MMKTQKEKFEVIKKVIYLLFAFIFLLTACIIGATSEKRVREDVLQINPTDETFNITKSNVLSTE